MSNVCLVAGRVVLNKGLLLTHLCDVRQKGPTHALTCVRLDCLDVFIEPDEMIVLGRCKSRTRRSKMLESARDVQ